MIYEKRRRRGGRCRRAQPAKQCVFALLLLTCPAQRQTHRHRLYSRCGSRFCISLASSGSRSSTALCVVSSRCFFFFLFESLRRVRRCRFHSFLWCFQFQLLFAVSLSGFWYVKLATATLWLDVVGCLLQSINERCCCSSSCSICIRLRNKNLLSYFSNNMIFFLLLYVLRVPLSLRAPRKYRAHTFAECVLWAHASVLLNYTSILRFLFFCPPVLQRAIWLQHDNDWSGRDYTEMH